MLGPTSFSQNNVFDQCELSWYLQKIKKIPAISDMSYAHGGNVIHKCLELYYKGEITDTETLKEKFNELWKRKGLETSVIGEKKPAYWLMILNGIALDVRVTSTEMKIYWPDVVGYIDGIHTGDGMLLDWKSSTRSEENEAEYKKQLKFYSYLYHRKFKKLPKKATVYYLKYNGSKGELSFEPTMQDVIDIEQWHFDIRKRMEKIIEEGKAPPKCKNCFFFCPYKNLCFNNNNTLKYTLHILGNYIQIDGQMNDKISKVLDKKFSYELKTAFFIKKHNPMAETKIRFWNPSKRLLPIGFRQGLIKTLEDWGKYIKKDIVIDIEEHRKFNDVKVDMPEKFINGVTLRDYQTDAVDKFIRSKIGVLEMGTGSGKTETAIEITRRLGIKTLFIVDKIELLRQTKERMEKGLGIKVGMIGQGVDEREDVTVATVQTLTKNIKDFAEYLRTIRLAIFDETHKVAARSYWKLAHHLINTEYRLGISGTAFRDDGNDMMIYAATGEKIYDLSAKTLIDKGWLVKPDIIFLRDYMTKTDAEEIERSCKSGLINETPGYKQYYEGFIELNEERNNTIVILARKHSDKKVLILTKLIRHGEILEKMLDGKARHLYGDTEKKVRKEMFDEFVDGDLNILISTVSIFSEGIDLPNLGVIINASANRGDVKSIQMLGRILRKIINKDKAIYYDFMDSSNFFRNASWARHRALRLEKHDVDIVVTNNIIAMEDKNEDIE